MSPTMIAEYKRILIPQERMQQQLNEFCNLFLKQRLAEMDTKKLRQKILDLAIRGKLVPQDPNDEPASVLLERIKAEKERLIKEGKIKRSKKTTKTSDTPIILLLRWWNGASWKILFRLVEVKLRQWIIKNIGIMGIICG